MSAASRRQRGHDTERIVADYLARNGWPHAEPVGAGRSGSDVTGLGPLWDCEVKARRGFDLTGTLRQLAERRDDDPHADDPAFRERMRRVPFAVIRPDGYGPARIADWPVVIRLADFVPLMRTWEDS